MDLRRAPGRSGYPEAQKLRLVHTGWAPPDSQPLTRLAICLQATAIDEMTVASSLSTLPEASSCSRRRMSLSFSTAERRHYVRMPQQIGITAGRCCWDVRMHAIDKLSTKGFPDRLPPSAATLSAWTWSTHHLPQPVVTCAMHSTAKRCMQQGRSCTLQQFAPPRRCCRTSMSCRYASCMGAGCCTLTWRLRLPLHGRDCRKGLPTLLARRYLVCDTCTSPSTCEAILSI